MEIVNGCFDNPKVTDYKYSELNLGKIYGDEVIPEARDMHFTEIQNQGEIRVPKTTYGCTCFALSHCINIENFVEGSNIMTKGEDIRYTALNRGADENAGWSLQEALSLGKDLGYIKGYSIVNGIDEMKSAICNNQVIYTGTNKCNWQRTKETGNFVEGNSYGHCIMIQGYNKEGFIARNSYGDDRGVENGLFNIGYDKIGLLFTTYAIVDKPNVDFITKHKKMIDDKMMKLTESLGLMNGKELLQPLTRGQAEIIFGRLYCKLAEKSVEDSLEDLLK